MDIDAWLSAIGGDFQPGDVGYGIDPGSGANAACRFVPSTALFENTVLQEPATQEASHDALLKVMSQVLPQTSAAVGGSDLDWASQVCEPIFSLRASRGDQVRSIQMGSLFAGTSSDTEVAKQLGIEAESLFTCDNKSSSWRFIPNNGPHTGVIGLT